MPFKTPDDLKSFLAAASYQCKEKLCPFETNDEDEFSRHAAEHVMIKAEAIARKKEVARARPKKELVNMLGKIIE